MERSSNDESLLDAQQLDRWLVQLGLKPSGSLAIESLLAGRSNEMFILRFDDRDGVPCEWVLRRPAGVSWEKSEQVLQREYRLLNILSPLDVPTPRIICFCEDRSVIGVMFYVMEHVAGFTPASGSLPAQFKSSVDLQHACARAGLEAVAQLHRIDWQAEGLGCYGNPDNFHERQVGRWLSQYEGYQGRPLPGLSTMGRWLEANLPARWHPTIMHGDYHPLNVLMAPDLPPRVAAIVDWETSTIGDPFLDLVGYLDIWYDVNHDMSTPDYDAMVDHYLTLVDFAPENLTYYRVLYYFRQSVLLEGIYQRSMSDGTREPMTQVGDHVDRMIQRAQTLINA